MIAAGVRDPTLNDSDREMIAQCHRAAIDVLRASRDDQFTASVRSNPGQ
jgi:hypothetical protein